MKYKLLKDLPRFEAGDIYKAGHIFETFEMRHQISVAGQLVNPKGYPDWFEPVIERWRAKPWDGDSANRYFCFRSRGDIFSSSDTYGIYDQQTFEFGNYFKTREQAEEASKRIKKVLMEYHAEIKE